MYIEIEREKIMKIGYRTPNLSKSLKARTTGRLKRQMKKAVNPLYGKNGMGLIKNPQKAIYNSVIILFIDWWNSRVCITHK